MLAVTTMAEEMHTNVDASREIISFAPLIETEKSVSFGTSIEDLELPETLTATVRTTSTTTSSTIEVEDSEADELEEVNDPQFEETTQIIPVTWTSRPEYDMDTEGDYVFSPVIEGYDVNIELPKIIVTVAATIMGRGLAAPLALTTYYDVWVGGVQVTDANKDNITGTGITGRVTYNSDTNTLTLDGAEVRAVYNKTDNDKKECQYGIYADISGLKIVVTGDNTIHCPDANSKYSYGIHTTGKMEISGTGSLDANSGKGSVSYGIYSNGELTIKSGTITGISNASATSLGIFGNIINIFGGDVNANSAGAAPTAMVANSYNITGGKITVTGRIGLSANNNTNSINISGGEINATGTFLAIRGVLNFNGGMVIARGETNALNGTLNLIKGIATASTNIDGSNAGPYDAANIENYKYIKVEPYKNGATITTPATEASKSYDQITVNPAVASENPGDQIIEYAISTSNLVEPTDSWQSDVLFTGLSPSTTYYVWARTAEKTGYNPGSPVASMGITTTAEPIKSVSVGSQSGTATAGKAGSLTYTVTTANIANGTYPVSVVNLPSGVTVGNSGNVTISDNSGMLTLTVANTAAAGMTSTLELTLNDTTSAPFTIVISEPVPVSYNLWVGGVQVKSANASNVLGNGTVTYDPATSTLILDGATITNNYSDDNGTYGIYANQTLKIVLKGENRVTAANINEKESLAIRIVNNPLTIEGSGSLTAKAGNVSGTVNYSSCGISANGLTINSGTVTAIGGTVPPGHTLSYGISSSNTLKFNGGTITAIGNNKSINQAPDLSDYIDLQVVASRYVSGTPAVIYKAADIANYKYLKFEPGPDTTITNLDLTSKLTVPATGGTPATSITDNQYTGTITWSDNPTKFLASRVYTATINLTAEDGYTFSGVAENAFSYDGASSVTNNIGSDQTLTVTIIFPQTEARTLEKIEITREATKTTYYYGEIFDKTGMIVKASYDDGTTDENFMDYTVDKTEALTLSDTLITLTANGTSIKTTQAITVAERLFIATVTNGTGSGSYAEGATVTITANDRSGYTFTGWSSTDITFTNAGEKTTSFTMPAKAVTVTANYRQNSSGGGYNGGGSGSSPSSGSGSGQVESSTDDNSISIIVILPTIDKPNAPTQGVMKLTGTLDQEGKLVFDLTDKNVNDAFEKALEDAKAKGYEQNGINLVLNISTGNKNVSDFRVNLPKKVQDMIISKKVLNTIVVVDNPDIRIGMDLDTIKEINKQANADVNITARPGDNSKLSAEAKEVIGSRPVFDLQVNYGNNKEVESFGTGRVTVSIPYTLGANEKAENIKAVYVDKYGKVNWITNSSYDSVDKVLIFSTDHFSTYAIGYMEDRVEFKDITGHWAKEDIDYVVELGLLEGTSTTIFSPNANMTRGMFVTVLGRLANIDDSNFQNSSYTDVERDAYYMGYIEWASKNNIVKGMGNGKFDPDQSITREQLAVILMNYAKNKGYDVSAKANLSKYVDSEDISSWALDAISWANARGLIEGSGDSLLVRNNATRAQVAAVLNRFVEEIIK